jgi:transcriptional regulator with XRE-family HTH domain
MKMKIEAQDPLAIRRRLGMTQEKFWGTLRVTQSGGSRYESGRDMPPPVRELLRVVYAESNPTTVSVADSEILVHLKARHPSIYRALQKEVASRTLKPVAQAKRANQAESKSKTSVIKQVRRPPIDLHT